MTHRIDIANTSACIVGGGIAGLATAAYLLRDGRLNGDKIHGLDASDQTGGRLDAQGTAARGCVMRGGRMFDEEANTCTHLGQHDFGAEPRGTTLERFVGAVAHHRQGSTGIRAAVGVRRQRRTAALGIVQRDFRRPAFLSHDARVQRQRGRHGWLGDVHSSARSRTTLCSPSNTRCGRHRLPCSRFSAWTGLRCRSTKVITTRACCSTPSRRC